VGFADRHARDRRRPRNAAGVALLALVALTAATGGTPAGAPVGGRALDPARFAPGSCIAFAPTAASPLHRTVFIDAGHGGPDPGGVGVTLAGHQVAEATENLRVALAALPLLRAAGYRVVLDRTSAGPVARPLAGDLSGSIYTAQGDHRDLIARAVCANLARAKILIGLYLNASDSPSLGGGLTLYDAARPFWPASRRLARLVQRDVLAALHARGWEVPDDGVHDDSGYGSFVTSADQAYGHLLILGPPKVGYLATPSEMPGALTEPLFVTDPAEASIAASAAGQHAIARGLVTAVGQYFAGAA
jgi:N-acetylmuramoyl-L-alanine amidase